ncbi:MAG: hypothetical protein IJM72_06645 [Deltaproteobacteria bacterium]|nr:hypothetical protein [Deltaproteobacteria bacterium]
MYSLIFSSENVKRKQHVSWKSSVKDGRLPVKPDGGNEKADATSSGPTGHLFLKEKALRGWPQILSMLAKRPAAKKMSPFGVLQGNFLQNATAVHFLPLLSVFRIRYGSIP